MNRNIYSECGVWWRNPLLASWWRVSRSPVGFILVRTLITSISRIAILIWMGSFITSGDGCRMLCQTIKFRWIVNTSHFLIWAPALFPILYCFRLVLLSIRRCFQFSRKTVRCRFWFCYPDWGHFFPCTSLCYPSLGLGTCLSWKVWWSLLPGQWSFLPL
jgi:hypothetical protein